MLQIKWHTQGLSMNFKGTSKYQKFSDLMKKKTHFTETEIDRLTNLHKTTMVEENVSRLTI